MKQYKILCYIPVESDEEILYDTLEEARAEQEALAFLQPENRYEIIAVEEKREIKRYSCKER